MVQPVRRSNHAHLLICRSCGEVCRFPDADSTEVERTSAEMKHFLEDQLLNDPAQVWSVRVVESSCLDVCPRGAVSVRLVGAQNADQANLTWSISSKAQLAELLESLKSHLSFDAKKYS